MRWPCCGGQAALAAWASVTIFSGCQGAAWVSEQIGVDLKSHFLEAFRFSPKMRLLIMRLYYTNKNACSVITNVLPANGGGHSISGSCISLRSLVLQIGALEGMATCFVSIGAVLQILQP